MDYRKYEDTRSGGLAMASMILGIVGLATCCCVYTAIICGALAVILSLLSRGGEQNVSGKAQAGLIMGIIGIVLGIGMIVASFVIVSIDYGGLDGYLEYYFDIYNRYDPYKSQFYITGRNFLVLK